jgi:hypothetical protein
MFFVIEFMKTKHMCYLNQICAGTESFEMQVVAKKSWFKKSLGFTEISIFLMQTFSETMFLLSVFTMCFGRCNILF